jgi:hypothetical protein
MEFSEEERDSSSHDTETKDQWIKSLHQQLDVECNFFVRLFIITLSCHSSCDREILTIVSALNKITEN